MKRKNNLYNLDLIIDKPENAGRFPEHFFLSANDLDHLRSLKDERFDGCYIRHVPAEKLTHFFFSYLNNLLKDNATVQIYVDQPIVCLQKSEARAIQCNAKFSGFDDFIIERSDKYEQLTDNNFLGQVLTMTRIAKVFNEDYEKYHVPAYVPKRAGSIGRKIKK